MRKIINSAFVSLDGVSEDVFSSTLAGDGDRWRQNDTPAQAHRHHPSPSGVVALSYEPTAG
jgi:hypothetical protein